MSDRKASTQRRHGVASVLVASGKQHGVGIIGAGMRGRLEVR